MAQASKRRFVFHFDLNNTILMKDDAKGLNTQDNVSLPDALLQKFTSLNQQMLVHIGNAHCVQERLG